MTEYKDLKSLKEVRDLVAISKKAQEEFKSFSQEKIDEIVRAMAIAASKEAEYLARLATEETGFGNWESKYQKNKLASDVVYDFIKDMKVVGLLGEDKVRKVKEIGIPVGVIAGLVPSTNPTSTTIYKALIAVKAGNSILFSPHPSAIKCISESARVVEEAAVAAGAPVGLVQCMQTPTLEGTDELMSHDDVKLILATGGSAMVKAAYSSGTPALGVGPGNVPAYIESSANIEQAVSMIFESKTFDNGMICASEESIIVDRSIKEKVIKEIENCGGYFLKGEEREKIAELLGKGRAGVNAAIVGKNVNVVAEIAGINIPKGTRLLLAEEDGVGPDHPYSKEKLTTVLGFYTVEDWKESCELTYDILEYDGLGHSVVVHSEDDEVVMRVAMEKPVSRVLVNTPASQGGVGLTTNLAPSLTLGCGAVGGSATSDNVTPMNLRDIRRVAYGGVKPKKFDLTSYKETVKLVDDNKDEIDKEMIVKLVMEEILKHTKK